MSADTITTITDDQIVAEYSGELDVWSVGIMLPDGTYVGVGCATEAEVPSAKAQVRARCIELVRTRPKCHGRTHRDHATVTCNGTCCTACGGPIDENDECRC